MAAEAARRFYSSRKLKTDFGYLCRALQIGHFKRRVRRVGHADLLYKRKCWVSLLPVAIDPTMQGTI